MLYIQVKILFMVLFSVCQKAYMDDVRSIHRLIILNMMKNHGLPVLEILHANFEVFQMIFVH